MASTMGALWQPGRSERTGRIGRVGGSGRLLLALLAAGLWAAAGLAVAATGHGGEVGFVQFELNIPGVGEDMLSPAWWAGRIPDPDRVIMTPAEIARYNRKNLRECPALRDFRTYKRLIAGSEVRELLAKVSLRPTRKLWANGQPVGPAQLDRFEAALNRDGIPENVEVQFGLTVRRTEMKSFPTFERVFSEPDDYEFDRFMETALYPVEPVMILHHSADGKWFLAQAYHYLAWLPAADIALTDRATLIDYLDTEPCLYVTGKHVFTAYNPIHPEISELQLEMGVRVPLARREEIPLEIDGQHPAGNYVIKLPARRADGRLEWRLGLVSRADDVSIGPLPLTRRNIVGQAFKFLGQHYGWGGMFNTRDCSAFILDNFRSMGLLLPRNAGEQGKLALGIRHEMPKAMTLTARKELFDRLPAGTPLYMEGHAMLYLGKVANDYYMIHDFAGFSAPDASGKLVRSKTRVVFVTPLIGICLSDGRPWLEGLYAAREFALDPPQLPRPEPELPRPPRQDPVRQPELDADRPATTATPAGAAASRPPRHPRRPSRPARQGGPS